MAQKYKTVADQQAIAILGGGLKWERGRWRTTNFDEKGNKPSALGDRLRVVAAAHLYHKNPKQIMIASGGRGHAKIGSKEPAVATIIVKELKEIKVPPDKIIVEAKSKNTYDQLIAIQNIMSKNSIASITIISNKYHLPRLKTMINHFPELRDLKKKSDGRQLVLRSAEEIVLRYNKEEWQEIIKNAYNSAGIKRRIHLEQKGVEDIKKGKYKFK